MYIRCSKNEIQTLIKSLTAILCVQISYLFDSNVTLPRTIHILSYLIHHLQEIYYQKSHEKINCPNAKGHHL